jgi:hypothetical protein
MSDHHSTWVRCSECGAEGPSDTGTGYAVKSWNTRYIAGTDGVDIDAIHRKHDLSNMKG